MGGEPTFVSIDDMESDQWNTKADGTHKRELANTLVRNLRKTFGKNGFLHHGQGKQYPGEPIPRWQLSYYWRKDLKDLWQDESLLADNSKDYGYGIKEAKEFTEVLTQFLNVSSESIQTVYEDIFYFLWEEGKPVSYTHLTLPTIA